MVVENALAGRVEEEPISAGHGKRIHVDLYHPVVPVFELRNHGRFHRLPFHRVAVFV